jgi:hypothetical protein
MWLKRTSGSFSCYCYGSFGRIDNNVFFQRLFWGLFFVIMKSFSTNATKDGFSFQQRLGNRRIQSVIVVSQELHGRRGRKVESRPETLKRTIVLWAARCSLVIVTVIVTR